MGIGSWSTPAVSTTRAGSMTQGRPHTEALHTIERFRRRDFGHLDVEVTIDDPEAYSKTWSFSMQFQFLADTEIMEDVCENNRDTAHLVGK
jgi:hypothetical protein